MPRFLLEIGKMPGGRLMLQEQPSIVEFWSDKSPSERSRVLLRIADLLEANTEELAIMESRNQGKPIKLSRDSDIPFAADNLRFFAGAARTLARVSHWNG